MITDARKQALIDRVARIPITDTLGFEFVDISEGSCTIRMPYSRKFDGVFASLHGGILMTIADSVAAFAVYTQVDIDEVITTTDMNIRFLAPCLSDCTAVATVIKLGRTLCPVSVDLFDEEGTRVAVAQVNYIRLPGMKARPQ